jgi:hypothetical protein
MADRVRDAPVSPEGGRPAIDTRRALSGIFWVLDNDAKCKDPTTSCSNRFWDSLYNTIRLHSSLGYRQPKPQTNRTSRLRCAAASPEAASTNTNLRQTSASTIGKRHDTPTRSVKAAVIGRLPWRGKAKPRFVAVSGQLVLAIAVAG